MTNVFGRTSTSLARAIAAALLLAATGLGAAACGSAAGPDATPAGSTAPESAEGLLGADAFAAEVERSGATVVDVRTPAEFASGHLAGAVNIDVQGSDFAAAVAALDPAGRYAVYCHSGNRSAVAVSYLRAHGFGSVVELAGGITAWQAAGRPVTTS